MYSHETNIRVRYAETDQMGYVYYGVYAQYFEIGRVELLRSLGFSYKELEKKGILLPVVHFSMDYFKPAFYDEELLIKTSIETLPSVKINFRYSSYNRKGDLLNTANTTLVFLNKETKKPCSAPGFLIQTLEDKI